MRLREVTGAQQRLLQDLSGRISNRLELEFSELGDGEGPNIGISLREQGRRVVIEIPTSLLAEAAADAMALETLRVRIKGRRDRMLFRAPPSPLPKKVVAAPAPGPDRPGFGRGGPGRGRR